MRRKHASTLLAALLLAPPAAMQADEVISSADPRDDAAWLRQKGTLIFQDTFERKANGNGMKAIGNGWESAAAVGAPQNRQADIEDGILKITGTIRREAGFADGGVSMRFKFPKPNAGESFALCFLVHSTDHLCCVEFSKSTQPNVSIITLRDRRKISDEESRRWHEDYLRQKDKRLMGHWVEDLESREKVVSWKVDHEWHDLVLVTEGDEMRLSIDSKLVATHRSEGFAHPTKRQISFGDANTVCIDAVKIWKVK